MQPAQLIAAASLLAVAPAAALAQCYGGACPNPSYAGGRQVVTSPAQAARLPRELFAAVARIVHHEQGGQSIGTGTLIADDREASHFLTCAHLFTEAGRTEVRLGGQQLPVRVVAIDRRHDLALLRGPPVGLTPVEAVAAQPSGPLTAGGFGPRGVPRFVRGPVLGMATAVGASSPSFRIRGAVRSGDSGGPVFDESGRVVAVVWGARQGETFAMGGAPLRRLLSRLRSSVQPISRKPSDRQSNANQGSDSRLTPIEQKPVPDAWRDGIERRLLGIDGRLDELANRKRPELPKDLVRTSDLNGLTSRLDGFERSLDQSQKSELTVLAEINARLDRFERKPERAPRDDPVASVPPPAPAFDPMMRPVADEQSSAEWLLSKLGALGTIGAALGVGGPLGVAAWYGSRWLTRRRETPRPWLHTAPTVVAVDTPPPPQQAVPETHYVPYEKDDYAKAHQWASEQTVRKYPGAVEILTSLDSLIDQKLNAKRPA